MTQIFKMVLSMSLSGAALIFVLLAGTRLLKGRLGRQWQYYIWLIAVMRLFLPFGPEASVMGQAYQAAERMMAQMTQATQAARPTGQSTEQRFEVGLGQSAGQRTEQDDGAGSVQNSPQFAEQPKEPDAENFSETAAWAGKYLWVIWLAVAFGMLIRKISIYQSYIRYVTAGAEPVCDVALLDQLAVTAQEMGVGRTVELCVNPLVASPMLVGCFHPCIILPEADVSDKEFPWIVMHELIHYRRRDIFYKWLVQITVCLHWFNPFVYLMSREMGRACEFSCDEAVVSKVGYDHAADYGKTLLDAMAAGGTYREPSAAVTMSANKEFLKERLGAIMSCKKKTKAMGMMTAGLTLGVALGAFFIGVYPVDAAGPEPDRAETAARAGKTEASQSDSVELAVLHEEALKSVAGYMLGEAVGSQRKAADDGAGKNADEGIAAQGSVNADAERYYKSGALPMFYIAFNEMEEKEQKIWLDRIYADGAVDFFSVSVWALDADSPLMQSYAEKTYEDGTIAFFSILAKLMDEETQEGWLDRAMADQKLNFQAMLYHELGRDEEMDELEKAVEEEQRKAYQAVGVTWNGKKCYYKEQLVRIFLDIHTPNQSFYTLDMNPAGKVDIKIVRTPAGQITGVAYMSETEAEALFGDLHGDDTPEWEELDEEETEEFPRELVVKMLVCNVREGAGEAYKVVGLVGEGESVTVLGKKVGKDGQMWYLLDQESLPEPPDVSVDACYIRADLLQEEWE
ncbi:MAG: hypothetical protein K2M20_13250 [Lachnospiraceae bacterium]|nr:hypothetical protein [Lachnospiraceae bacterium]